MFWLSGIGAGLFIKGNKKAFCLAAKGLLERDVA
jgi:hypothetical protein